MKGLLRGAPLPFARLSGTAAATGRAQALSACGVGAAALVLLYAILSTAWVCDDAYMSFRAAWNLAHGYGLTHNPGTRVQAFTNPLWTLLHVPWLAVFDDPFYPTLALSLVVDALAIGAALRWGVHTPVDRALWLGLLALARGFVDFSTSGLEGPLLHLLLVLFVLVWLRRESHPLALAALSGLAALLMLTRMDSVLLVGPALAVAVVRQRERRPLRALLLGFLPLLAWVGFALLYYGFAIPNTAYAKLGASIPRAELLERGLGYLDSSLRLDPLTLTTIGAALVACGVRARRWWPVCTGVTLHLIYSVWIGGDFMSGRFLTAPFLVCALLLARELPPAWSARPAVALGAYLLAAVVGFPTLTTGLGVRQVAVINRHGVNDSRSYYYPESGLFSAQRDRRQRRVPRVAPADTPKGERCVRVVESMGQQSYWAGPAVHVIDRFALGDPLLAHLAAIPSPARRPGHYERAIPAGYLRTLRTGHNGIDDPRLAHLYDRLARVTRGPLLDRARLADIARFATSGVVTTSQRPSMASGPSAVTQPGWNRLMLIAP